ncbi:MAG: family NAD(P)-dependent oxidoreductase, partial [Nocardioides sp.]|nr:family NAD(P)-dependent oxidoreductase [Nocardioides sp.]
MTQGRTQAPDEGQSATGSRPATTALQNRGMSTPRTAVVTGASSGIGAATARALAAEGLRVVCAARRRDRIEALAAEIGGVAVACDVTSLDSVRELAEAVGDVVHVLVNNAGGAFGSDLVETADPADWRAMYEVNVIGLLQVTQALLPALRASGDALIVNMGSTAGRIAYETGGGYTAAKHGTQVVTETLRLELWD